MNAITRNENLAMRMRVLEGQRALVTGTVSQLPVASSVVVMVHENEQAKTNN